MSDSFRLPADATGTGPAPDTAVCAPEGGACGCHGNPVFDGMDARYRRVLWTVIAINAAMFGVETAAGHLAGSQALKADALDFLGDALTYGMSLAVIGQPLRMRATAALVKGASLVLMGLWVMASTAWQVLVLGVPSADVMGVIGFLALAANLASVGLLMRYKDGDANVRSVWLCSRNDAVGNVLVMGAAVAVWGFGSAWPDLVVAALMGSLFLTSAVQILRRAAGEYRSDGAHSGGEPPGDGHAHGHGHGHA
jgi:Co/Zn/Cd efflux system component